MIMADEQINVALVGLGFGAEFVPIYLHHPRVGKVAICDTDPKTLAEVGERYDVNERFDDLPAVLNGDDYDAVHLVTPIPLHAQQTVEVLESGRHCACTVPMATTVDDLRAIIHAVHRSGRNYMMMETAVYTREFLFVKDMLDRGEFGRIQFLRGAHYQDMENWPAYWMGLPPMHYATHAVAPVLALADTRAVRVHCFGSGKMRAELHEPYKNPYPVETAIFELDGLDVAAEVTRSLFHTARDYTESFSVLGENVGFEWQQIESEKPVLFRMEPLRPGRGRPVRSERIEAPDRRDLLPTEIARFTQRGVYDESNPHRSFEQGGGHGGSHPHLVHEFVSSILENRPASINEITAANWTAPGICAHESAMKAGQAVDIPAFEKDE
jgi:predicted dehydrogenase